MGSLTQDLDARAAARQRSYQKLLERSRQRSRTGRLQHKAKQSRRPTLQATRRDDVTLGVRLNLESIATTSKHLVDYEPGHDEQEGRSQSPGDTSTISDDGMPSQRHSMVSPLRDNERLCRLRIRISETEEHLNKIREFVDETTRSKLKCSDPGISEIQSLIFQTCGVLRYLLARELDSREIRDV